MKLKINYNQAEKLGAYALLYQANDCYILLKNRKSLFYKTFNKIEKILDEYNLEYMYIKKSSGAIYIKDLKKTICFFWSTFGGGFKIDDEYFYFNLDKLREYLDNNKQFIFYNKLNQNLKIKQSREKKGGKI